MKKKRIRALQWSKPKSIPINNIGILDLRSISLEIASILSFDSEVFKISE